MGFFDSLIKSAGRTIGREVGKKAVKSVVDALDGDDNDKKKKTTSKKKTTQSNVSASSPMAKASAKKKSEYNTTPDLPRSFEGLNGWLCIKGSTPQEVIRALGLLNDMEANWESGLKAVNDNFMKKVFVTPLMNGYVLALGYIPFGVMNSVNDELKVLDKLADNFDEMTCYSTQSTVDIHVWAKYTSGKLVRGYGWFGESGEVYLNKGNVSAEEVKLGYSNLITDPDCDWDTVIIPDTEHVFAMAKEWGVSPDLSDVNLSAGTGFVCDL